MLVISYFLLAASQPSHAGGGVCILHLQLASCQFKIREVLKHNYRPEEGEGTSVWGPAWSQHQKIGAARVPSSL